MDKKSRIYIAGHQGLIGSAIHSLLEKEGYTNLIIRSRQQLELTDPHAVVSFFSEQKPEYVILAAGQVGGIIENGKFPADFIKNNLAIQLNVFEAAQQNDVKRLIFFASSCMYPRQTQQPMPESALLSGHPEPSSLPYAISKLAGLQMCLAYNKQYQEKRFIPLIPNSAFGKNDNFNPESGHVLSALIQRFHHAKKNNLSEIKLWGSGSVRREFIHASDIAQACLFILSSDIAKLELPVNIGSGEELSIQELAEKISTIIGYSGKINWDPSKPEGAPRKLLDSTRINNFGWKPAMDFEQGLVETYHWYLDHVDKYSR
jgi:GDP-L-fucose synthase